MYFRTKSGAKEYNQGDQWYHPEVVEGWQQPSSSHNEHIPWTPFVIVLVMLVLGFLALMGFEYAKKK